ncbi:MAG TPA: adenylate cyclase regulatory domain-containing protein [Candidatus Binatia bacterium]|jgi:class 3 adenylate cyclase
MEEKDFIDAGLYDPAAPDAAGRLALLGWLVARGITLEQMTRHTKGLSGLAGDLALRPGPRFSPREVAEREAIALEDVMTLSLASGFAPADPDEPTFTEADTSVFAAFMGGAGMFGRDAVLRFTRVVGSSMARIAEAAVSLFQAEVEQKLIDSGASELHLAQQNLTAIENLGNVRSLLHNLFAVHMETAIRRIREARLSRSPDAVRFAVGFVDLVGFTTITRDIHAHELDLLVSRFENIAYDVVAMHDGRLVKLIGDEVMFVTRSTEAACSIALTLFERFALDGGVTPRGAIAYGDMLVRGGDYYGPIVNLASRVAQIAVPNELLVTAEVASLATGGALSFEAAGKRMLKGFDAPIALMTAARAK